MIASPTLVGGIVHYRRYGLIPSYRRTSCFSHNETILHMKEPDKWYRHYVGQSITPMKMQNTALFAALGLAVASTFYTSGCSSMTGKSTGEYIDDAAITTKEKAALLREHIHVNVDTNRGVVVLNGFVDNADERTRAEQVARSVAGVQAVQNNLTVKTQVAPQ